MIKTKKQSSTLLSRQTYAPSILMIGRDPKNTENLRVGLENNGCQVRYISHKIDQAIRHQYYDLAVIDIDNYRENTDTYKQLTHNCALSQMPLIILSSKTADMDLDETLSVHFPIYHICQDIATESILLQLVNQIHYMTYRYT